MNDTRVYASSLIFKKTWILHVSFSLETAPAELQHEPFSCCTGVMFEHLQTSGLGQFFLYCNTKIDENKQIFQYTGIYTELFAKQLSRLTLGIQSKMYAS